MKFKNWQIWAITIGILVMGAISVDGWYKGKKTTSRVAEDA